MTQFSAIHLLLNTYAVDFCSFDKDGLQQGLMVYYVFRVDTREETHTLIVSTTIILHPSSPDRHEFAASFILLTFMRTKLAFPVNKTLF